MKAAIAGLLVLVVEIIGKPGQLTTASPCTGLKGICYYNRDSQFRAERTRFMPEDIDISFCSHLAYQWAKISNNRLILADESDEQLFRTFNAHKLTNSQLKTFLAVGGANFPMQQSLTMLSNSKTRGIFVSSVIELLREHGFDGLDLHCDIAELKKKKEFSLLIQEMKNAFYDDTDVDKETLLLMVSTQGSTDKITCDVQIFHRSTDFIHIKATNYHTSGESVTALNAPLFKGPTDQDIYSRLNVDYSTKYITSMGVPKDKLVIGISFNGLGFTLRDENKHGLSSPVVGPSAAALYTKKPGYFAYFEICSEFLTNSLTKTVWLDEQKSIYAYRQSQWVSFENPKSIEEKVNWIKMNGYGGWSVLDVSLDDFHGDMCGKGSNPLFQSINNGCREKTTKPTTLSSTTTKTTTPIVRVGPATLTNIVVPTSRTTTTPPKSTELDNSILLITSQTQMIAAKTCERNGRFSDADECNSFIECVDGVATKVKCDHDKFFDPSTMKCVRASKLSDERKMECSFVE